MNFREWVSQETAAYGSQKGAAAAYGLSQTQWSRYTRGAPVGEATLARLRDRSSLALVVEPLDDALEHVDQVDEDDPERAELLELHAEIEAEGEADEQASAREAGELLAEGLALVIARGGPGRRAGARRRAAGSGGGLVQAVIADRLLTNAEVAERLRVSRARVYALQDSCGLPYVAVGSPAPGQRVQRRVPERELAAWIAARRRGEWSAQPAGGVES